MKFEISNREYYHIDEGLMMALRYYQSYKDEDDAWMKEIKQLLDKFREFILWQPNFLCFFYECRHKRVCRINRNALNV